MISVLIVEDSPLVREFLTYILNSDPQIQVVGTACDGQDALERLPRLKVDVITMDINMPKLDGFETTRRIMETQPTPIIIVSGSVDVKEVETTFRALEAGALAVVPRPAGIGHPDFERAANELVQNVKLMSEVKVVRRWPRSRVAPADPVRLNAGVSTTPSRIQAVAIGASTGGPLVLQTILSGLPKEFPVPLLIVQHIAAGFIHGFADWLARSSGFPVQVARDGEPLLAARAYLAPDGSHLGVTAAGRAALNTGPPENGLRPSASYLFRSVAQVFGRNAAGVLLTGMGRDGATELKLLHDFGALTLAQDQASSVVHGMPGEAIKLGAVTYVLSPDRIAAALRSLVTQELFQPVS